MDEPATTGSLVERPAEPADRPAEEEPTTPVPTASPTASPTADPDPTDGDGLTRAEATARCLESGISSVDVLALGACVEGLLG